MPQTTLITAWEVVKYSPESDKFPAAYVGKHIYRKEQYVRRDVLGKDFYDAMLADLVDFGEPEEWSSLATYASGDYVKYFDTILQSTLDDNAIEPCVSGWVEPDKFETECYNLLWVDGDLRGYLAFLIIADAVVHPTYPSGAKGVTEWISEGNGSDSARSAKQNIVAGKQTTLRKEADEILANLKEWVKDKLEDDLCEIFEDLKFIADCGNPTISNSRRIAFRNTDEYH